jgi:FXSXX-COOH protein
MLTDAMAPVPLIDLSQYDLTTLVQGDSSALDEAIARIVANAENADTAMVCAFNSAI